MSHSLYITSDNQELLWNTINKTPLIQKIPAGQKDNWFRNIIQQFHEKHHNITDTITLQKINRETIKCMMDKLNIIGSQPTPQLPPPQQHPYSQIQPTYFNKEAEKAQKQEIYNRAFEERQQQFNKMFEKPPIPEVNFSEKLDDEPISNMTELIERHKKEREAEVQKISGIHNIMPPSDYPNQFTTPKESSMKNIQNVDSSSKYSEKNYPINTPIMEPNSPTDSSLIIIKKLFKDLDDRLQKIEEDVSQIKFILTHKSKSKHRVEQPLKKENIVIESIVPENE